MRRRQLEFVLKLVVVFGLLYFLARKGWISVSVKDTQRAFGQPEILVPALLLLLFSTSLGVFRWKWLLAAQGIHLKWLRVFELTFVGLFFNIALPGAVSGDFVKAFYVGREAEGKRAKAFGSILFDRVAGLAALALVSAGALLFGAEQFWGTPMFIAIHFGVTVAAISVIAFFSYLFLVREHHDPLLRAFKLAEKKIPRAGSLTRIYESLRHYHNHRWTVVKVLALSVFVHLMVGWSMLQFARALGDQQLALLALYVVFPLGLLVTAIPVTPAGIGTGHAAFFYLLSLIGSRRGADIFTLFTLYNLFVGALGGLIYMRFRAHSPKPDFASAQA